MIEKTLSEMESASDNGSTSHINLMGPFTLAAITEMLYRVKKYSFSASLSGVDSEDNVISGSLSSDGTARKPINSLEDTADEMDIFRYNRQSDPPISDTGFKSSCVHRRISGETDYQKAAFAPYCNTDLNSMTGHVFCPVFSPRGDIIKDENGKYWIEGDFYMRCHDGSDDLVGDILPYTDGGGGTAELLINASIVLYCGTFPIEVSAYSPLVETLTSASLTITATEWFPWATTTGAAAWNTSTGAAANGGPLA